MTTAIVAILVFGLLVFFHELGHFGVAKTVGIRVHEFAIGMGPKVLHYQTEETLYSIRGLPIGGFVKMEGEDESSNSQDSFSQKSIPARMSVIFAGPFMNFLLGFLCFFVIFYSIGSPSTVIDQVIPDSPAERSGLQEFDQVVAVDSVETATWEQLVETIAASEGNEITVQVRRDGEVIDQVIKPTFDEQTGRPMIGIVPGTQRSFLTAVRAGYEQSKMILTEILKFLQRLIRGQADTAEVAGPVGIISLVGQASRSGWIDVVGLAGLISINLGIMNLLPIPALDGSRLVFLVLEALRGRPVDPEKEALVHMVGITLLLLLMIVITYKDILHFF